MSSFDPSAHRLAGSNSSKAGGLILKGGKSKAEVSSDAQATFKRPTTSLLGLDRLARRKREEREAEAASFPEKKARTLHPRDEESDTYDRDVRISFGKSSRSQDARMYRGALVETPSHTGGVDEEALQKMQSRLIGRDHKGQQGVYASTKKSKEGGRDREVRRDRYVIIFTLALMRVSQHCQGFIPGYLLVGNNWCRKTNILDTSITTVAIELQL